LLANPDFSQAIPGAAGGNSAPPCLPKGNSARRLTRWKKRLAPEIPWQARALGGDAEHLLRTFQSDLQSFRNQVRHRRNFILAEIKKQKP